MNEPRWNGAVDNSDATAAAAQRGKFALSSALTFAIVCALTFLLVRPKPAQNFAPPLATTTPVSSVAIAPNVAPTATFITWENSFESAMQRAQKERKMVMIDFYTDWCGVCKNVDAETYPDASVIQESQNFVMVKVNAEARTDLATRFGIHQYPTFVFTMSAGRCFTRAPRVTAQKNSFN